jgi:hypothetical protein
VVPAGLLPVKECVVGHLLQGQTLTSARVRMRWFEHQPANGCSAYFLPFPARLRFDPAAASRSRLPILKRTAVVAGIFKLSPVCKL